MSESSQDYDNVYGDTYSAAKEQMELVVRNIQSQAGAGFSDPASCAQWAKDNHLDKLVYMTSSRSCFRVSHRGEIVTTKSFRDMYGNVLFYMDNEKKKRVYWQPDSDVYLNKLYITSEQTDGIHAPLFHRNYFTPPGYYDPYLDSFNVAKTSPIFARETGRDTSHIYTYLEHLGQECFMWLLAWLRAKMIHPMQKTQVIPVIVSTAQGTGKGQPLTSSVLGKNGYIALCSFKHGARKVISPVDGKEYPAKLTNVGVRHVNRVLFSNGAEVFCDDDHLWFVQREETKLSSGQGEVVPISALRDPRSRNNVVVPLYEKSRQWVHIVGIEDAGEDLCGCLIVDSPDHLYVTDHGVVTHNSSFGEVICKGLFGRSNVLVTDQYDSQARFNSDYADALIVCQEEKEEADRRNPASSIKSRATSMTIRKEMKGIDPIYQDSYTDFIITTNKDVPIKFDGREDQRRFMVMNTDEHFTRKESALADEVFTKLYGYDARMVKRGTPFIEDTDLIAQFKHELFTSKEIGGVDLRKFPKTAAYHKCFSLPRTNEMVDVEALMFALAPFIRASLVRGVLITELGGQKLDDIAMPNSVQVVRPEDEGGELVIALCRPVVFSDAQTKKAYPHAMVERALYGMKDRLAQKFDIMLDNNMEALKGGFKGMAGRNRYAGAARFSFCGDKSELQQYAWVYQNGKPVYMVKKTPGEDTVKKDEIEGVVPNTDLARNGFKVKNYSSKRNGVRFRVNDKFLPDPNGCYETVNELPKEAVDLKNKTARVLYMDTFVLEADEINESVRKIEEAIVAAKQAENKFFIDAAELYKERLKIQLEEAERLFKEGVACRVVDSGAKSIHILVRVSDSPKNLEEYKWLHGYLCASLSSKVSFDPSTCDPARLTRSPLTIPRTTVAYGLEVRGTQKLLHLDFTHIYRLQWRSIFQAWKQRPLSSVENRGKKLMPMKGKYRDAMAALLSGRFWVDSEYNGQRQELFFPAYRLLRMGGYTHDELWKNILMQNIESYYKPAEIRYWRSRQSCPLVREIDESVSEYETIDNIEKVLRELEAK